MQEKPSIKKIYPAPVLIDGTLREGEQSAGVFFTEKEKIRLVKLMDKAGIDIADSGMPAVSHDEFLSIKKLSSLRGISLRIGASIRCRADEIDLFKKTGASDCFIIVPVSEIHIREKFGLTPLKYLDYVKKSLGHAEKTKIKHIHIALEDTSRACKDFLSELFGAFNEFNIEAAYLCDTLGVALPDEIKCRVESINKIISAPEKLHVGIHCHNDFGLALANTLAAFEAGATHLTFTQNGIGERAGNAKFHELAMALTRLYGLDLKLCVGMIPELSRYVEEASAIFMSAIEPVVGFNAYRHESGIHVSGLLRNRAIYEQYRPEDIGKINEFVLGKHSGRAIIDKLLAELFTGFDFSAAQKMRILSEIKKMKTGSAKRGFKAMRSKLENFYGGALGGVSREQFVKIAEKVKRDEKK